MGTDIKSLFRRQDTALVRLRGRAGAQDSAAVLDKQMVKSRQDPNEEEERGEQGEKQSPVTIVTHWNGVDQHH